MENPIVLWVQFSSHLEVIQGIGVIFLGEVQQTSVDQDLQRKLKFKRDLSTKRESNSIKCCYASPEGVEIQTFVLSLLSSPSRSTIP